MVAINKPTTLTRVSVFRGDLEKAIRNFSYEFKPIKVGLGNTRKYALYKEGNRPYLLMISQQIDRQITNLEGIEYNTILTVTSRYPERNKKVSEKFQERTEIDFIQAPKKLATMMQGLGLSFTVFERYGESAMNVLRNL